MRFVAFALAGFLAGHSSVRISDAAAREVEIVGVDYAFRAPSELPAGPTRFSFRSEGKVNHEMVIFLLKKDETVDQFINAQKIPGTRSGPLIEGAVGILFAVPGKRWTNVLLTDLIAGRQYVIFCALRDTANAPRHFEMGMYSVINVRGAEGPRVSRGVKADTIVATEYAFRYATTISSGHHIFALRNEGKVGHEFFIALLKKGATTEMFIKARKANANPQQYIDERNGILLSPGPTQQSLGDLDVNLLPGRDYRLVCNFMDDPKSPPHVDLGMYGTIHVSGTAQ
ncbi:MAG: hypothetical protein ABR582_05685 [Gemmatimonadaceae bacterium]